MRHRPALAPGAYPELPLGEDLESSTLRDYVGALWRHKWLLIAAAAAGLAIGTAIAIREPLPYPARTSVEVQGINESFMKLNEVDPQASAGIYAATTFNIQTQVRILNSYTLRRRVVDRLEREMIPSLPPRGTGIAAAVNRVRSALGLNPAEPARALREALLAASASALAKAVPETRVIEMSCESTHPEVGAEFLNALVSEFIDQGSESRAGSSRRTSQWLAGQLEDQKSRLEQAEASLRDFVARAGVAGLTQEDSRSTLAQSKLQQLQQELSAIQADRIRKQSLFEIASVRGVEALPELAAGSALPGQRDRLASLAQQKAQLLATLLPAHYKLRRVQSQIDEIEAAMRKEKAEILQRIRNEYEAALRREQLLSAAYATQSGALLAQADKATQYSLLRREVDSNRQIYNLMVQQVNQAGIASAVPTNNIRVIDPATPAFEPSYSNIYIDASLGWTTGLLFGSIFAIVRQQLDRRLRRPGQISGALRLPELGVIFSEAGRGRASRVELVTHDPKPSPVAESFRATLMSILFSVENQKHCLWSITSPNPKEGKSTVASNLAIALAELKRRVLVVDADLRKPRLHEIFELPNARGLSDVLQESTPLPELPSGSLWRSTPVPNLDLLTSGPPVSVVNTVLCSDRMRDLLERARREFDIVLIDCPPMLVLPDARIVGQMADAVILVFRSGVTSLEDARAASDRLAADGTRILGTVLNDWQPQALGGDRHYHSYYQQC